MQTKREHSPANKIIITIYDVLLRIITVITSSSRKLTVKNGKSKSGDVQRVLCRPHAARGKVSRMRMTGSLGRLLSK
jgi:hypothetical protein